MNIWQDRLGEDLEWLQSSSTRQILMNTNRSSCGGFSLSLNFVCNVAAFSDESIHESR